MIDDLLTEKQKEGIVTIIQNQCRRFQAFENQYEDLFYEPYTKMRHKHTATSAVISGFAPGKFSIQGIKVQDLKYGLNDNMAQPELQCDNGVFHIYSDGSDLRGKKIIERCEAMNEDTNSIPVFFMVVAHLGKDGALNKIEICLPNKYGTIVERSIIYDATAAPAAVIA